MHLRILSWNACRLKRANIALLGANALACNADVVFIQESELVNETFVQSHHSVLTAHYTLLPACCQNGVSTWLRNALVPCIVQLRTEEAWQVLLLRVDGFVVALANCHFPCLEKCRTQGLSLAAVVEGLESRRRSRSSYVFVG